MERPSGDRRKSRAGRRRQGGEGVACEGGWGWGRLVGGCLPVRMLPHSCCVSDGDALSTARGH